MILYTIWDTYNRQYPIRDGIWEGLNEKDGQYLELLPIMVGLAGSVWLYTQSQNHLWDWWYSNRKKKHMKLIIEWYSTQEKLHSTGGIELEMASKMDLLIIVGLTGSVLLNT